MELFKPGTKLVPGWVPPYGPKGGILLLKLLIWGIYIIIFLLYVLKKIQKKFKKFLSKKNFKKILSNFFFLKFGHLKIS